MTVAADKRRSEAIGPSKPRLLAILGPGLITGASDDDPSGIATYSQAGAQFGYGLLWVMLLTYPLMAATQEISARIGRITGRGIAGNVARHYPPWLLQGSVLLLLIANIINLGADLGAMGDVARLLIGGSSLLYVVLFGALCIVAQVFLEYARYVKVLKWTTLSLLTYVATALIVKIPWGQVAFGFFVPSIALDKDSITTAVAVLGTTISPYLFFWQSSQEAEDIREKPERDPLLEAPRQAPEAIERIRLDTYIGMALSNIVGAAIIVTTAATLHAHGVTNVDTSAQAAEALRPIAGPFAAIVFAVGIIGTGLLAVPVLAGSAAYAIGEARRWPIGLARRPLEAKAFYGTLAVATVLGTAMNFTAIDPVKALFWSAVINGVMVVPIMGLMMLISRNPKVMGRFVIRGRLAVIGWLATAVMGVSVVAFGVASVL